MNMLKYIYIYTHTNMDMKIVSYHEKDGYNDTL